MNYNQVMDRSRTTRMHFTRHLKATFVILIAIGLAACDVEVIGEHEPMHPINEPVHIRAVASGDVTKVEIWVGSSHVDANGDETPISPLTLVKTCDPSGINDNYVCRHTVQKFNDYTMVDLRVVVFGPFYAQDAETYRFAAGNVRFPDAPIPIRVKSDDILNTLDIVMIRDLDVPNNFFRSYLDDVIKDSFMKYGTYRNSRHLYNYYYSGIAGNYTFNGSLPWNDQCIFVEPSNWGSLTHAADTIVFLHAEYFTDCAYSDKFSSEIWFDKTMIHEAGHALFDVRDEWPVNDTAAHPPQSCTPNLWASKFACEAAAPGLGLPKANCRLRKSGQSTWIIDPEGPTGCLMNGSATQWLEESNYGPACSTRVAWRHDKCESATEPCITVPECP
jgi:hypothetical protein